MILLIVCAVVAVCTLLRSEENREIALIGWGAQDRELIGQGEWWRTLSAAFLHADWKHLLANAYGIAILGTLVEITYGSARLLTIYTLSAIGASY